MCTCAYLDYTLAELGFGGEQGWARVRPYIGRGGFIFINLEDYNAIVYTVIHTKISTQNST